MGELEISRRALLALAASGLVAAEPPRTLGQVSDSYVEVALAIGEHDPNYVDAYHGPEETRTKVKADGEDLATLARRVSELHHLPKGPLGDRLRCDLSNMPPT
jgi:hypothetical protein